MQTYTWILHTVYNIIDKKASKGAEKSIAYGVSQIVGNAMQTCGTFLHCANVATLHPGYMYGAFETMFGPGFVYDSLMENGWTLKPTTSPETYYAIERDVTHTVATKTTDWMPDESTLSDNENSNANNNKKIKSKHEKLKEKDKIEQKGQIQQTITLPSNIDYTQLEDPNWLSNNIIDNQIYNLHTNQFNSVISNDPKYKDYILEDRKYYNAHDEKILREANYISNQSNNNISIKNEFDNSTRSQSCASNISNNNNNSNNSDSNSVRSPSSNSNMLLHSGLPDINDENSIKNEYFSENEIESDNSIAEKLSSNHNNNEISIHSDDLNNNNNESNASAQQSLADASQNDGSFHSDNINYNSNNSNNSNNNDCSDCSNNSNNSNNSNDSMHSSNVSVKDYNTIIENYTNSMNNFISKYSS